MRQTKRYGLKSMLIVKFSTIYRKEREVYVHYNVEYCYLRAAFYALSYRLKSCAKEIIELKPLVLIHFCQ